MIGLLLRSIGGKVAGYALLAVVGTFLLLWYERQRAKLAAAKVALAAERRKAQEARALDSAAVAKAAGERVVVAEAHLRDVEDRLAEARARREELRETVTRLLTPAALEERARRVGV